jgi:hypothetical protein
MSEEVSLHLYYSIIGLASLILFSGEITLLYNYTVFRHARYGVIPNMYPPLSLFRDILNCGRNTGWYCNM